MLIPIRLPLDTKRKSDTGEVWEFWLHHILNEGKRLKAGCVDPCVRAKVTNAQGAEITK